MLFLLPDAQQGPHEERLIDDILVRQRYNRLARPVPRETDALEVEFGISLQQIIEVVSSQFKTFQAK